MQNILELPTELYGVQRVDLNSSPEELLNAFDAEALIEAHKCFETKDNYERIVLHKTDDIEIVFCHWKENNESAPHFHPEVECWFKCLKGELTEFRGEEEKVTKITKGNIAHINDSFGGHQISNKSNKCTFTLHLYKKR
jgi:hypothetical protein